MSKSKFGALARAAARRMQTSSVMRTVGAVGAGVMAMVVLMVVVLRGPLVLSATITIAMSVLVMTLLLRWQVQEKRGDKEVRRNAP